MRLHIIAIDTNWHLFRSYCRVLFISWESSYSGLIIRVNRTFR